MFYVVSKVGFIFVFGVLIGVMFLMFWMVMIVLRFFVEMGGV